MFAVRLTHSRTLATAAALLGLAGLAQPAHAVVFNTTDVSRSSALFSQFNVVVSGTYADTTANSNAIGYTYGRVIAGSTNLAYNAVCYGGSCTGNQTGAAIDASGAKYGALTVFGAMTSNGGGGVTGVGLGSTYLGGTTAGQLYQVAGGQTIDLKGNGSGLTVSTGGAAGTIQTNATSFAGTNSAGAAVQTKVALSTVFPFGSTVPISSEKTLSTGLANLPGSPGVNAQALGTVSSANGGIFTTNTNDYVTSGHTYGIITTTVANLASQTNFNGISNGTNAATIVVVTGDGAGYTLPNLNSYADASKVIFDFVNATTLNFAGSWNGTILAPLATLNQNSASGILNGSIVVANLNQMGAIYDSNLFTGDLTGLVPEPASIALLGLGAGVAALVRRRRK